MSENLDISCPCEYCSLAGGGRKFVFPVTSLSQGGRGGSFGGLWERKQIQCNFKQIQMQRKGLLTVDYILVNKYKAKNESLEPEDFFFQHLF